MDPIHKQGTFRLWQTVCYLRRSTGVLINLRLDLDINNSCVSRKILSKNSAPKQEPETGCLCWSFKNLASTLKSLSGDCTFQVTTFYAKKNSTPARSCITVVQYGSFKNATLKMSSSAFLCAKKLSSRTMQKIWKSTECAINLSACGLSTHK